MYVAYEQQLPSLANANVSVPPWTRVWKSVCHVHTHTDHRRLSLYNEIIWSPRVELTCARKASVRALEPGLRNARFHGERGNGTYARKSSDLRIRASRLVRNAANTSPERSEIHSLIISSLSRSFVSLLCSLSFCVLSFLSLNFFFFNPSHQPFDLHTNFCLPHPFLPPSFQTIDPVHLHVHVSVSSLDHRYVSRFLSTSPPGVLVDPLSVLVLLPLVFRISVSLPVSITTNVHVGPRRLGVRPFSLARRVSCRANRQICREKIKGLQSKIQARIERSKMLAQRGTPDLEPLDPWQ